MSKSSKNSPENHERTKQSVAKFDSQNLGGESAVDSPKTARESERCGLGTGQQSSDNLVAELAPQEVPGRAMPAKQELTMSWLKVSEHFGLREEPFRMNYDLRFYFNGRTPSEALANLISGVGTGVRTQILIGRPGVGKSILLRKVAEMLQGFDCLAVAESNPLSATVEGMLNSLADQAGLDCKGIDKPEQKLAAILGTLCDQSQAIRAVLILDEAQAFPIELISDLLHLSQIEFEGQKLQLIFGGLNKLETDQAQPTLPQLMPTTESYQLDALTVDEVEAYVVHRLRVAGAKQPELLMPGAINQIVEHSKGVPSKINSLCANALLIAYLEGAPSVSAETVSKIAIEGFEQWFGQTQDEKNVTATMSSDRATQTKAQLTAVAKEGATQPENKMSRKRERSAGTLAITHVLTKGRKSVLLIVGIMTGIFMSGGFAFWWMTSQSLRESPGEQVTSSNFPGTTASSQREPAENQPQGESVSSVSAREPVLTLPTSELRSLEEVVPQASEGGSTQISATTEYEAVPIQNEANATELQSEQALTLTVSPAAESLPENAAPQASKKVPILTTEVTEVEAVSGNNASEATEPQRESSTIALTAEPVPTLPAPSAARPLTENATLQPSEEASEAVKREDTSEALRKETVTKTSQLSPSTLMVRGNSLLATGDLAGARLFFELAARKGNVAAMTGVGKTYDPLFYVSSGVEGTKPDPTLARQWYQEASVSGDEEGAKRLSELNTWLERGAFR